MILEQRQHDIRGQPAGTRQPAHQVAPAIEQEDAAAQGVHGQAAVRQPGRTVQVGFVDLRVGPGLPGAECVAVVDEPALRTRAKQQVARLRAGTAPGQHDVDLLVGETLAARHQFQPVIHQPHQAAADFAHVDGAVDEEAQVERLPRPPYLHRAVAIAEQARQRREIDAFVGGVDGPHVRKLAIGSRDGLQQ